jgi:hypothetical protein
VFFESLQARSDVVSVEDEFVQSRQEQLVNGSNDIVVPTINSYILQQNLLNAELILFPDSNHGSHFQFTEPFNRYIGDFLAR